MIGPRGADSAVLRHTPHQRRRHLRIKLTLTETKAGAWPVRQKGENRPLQSRLVRPRDDFDDLCGAIPGVGYDGSSHAGLEGFGKEFGDAWFVHQLQELGLQGLYQGGGADEVMANEALSDLPKCRANVFAGLSFCQRRRDGCYTQGTSAEAHCTSLRGSAYLHDARGPRPLLLDW